MPRPAHHAALAAANGKIYVMRRLRRPEGHRDPDRRRMATHRRRVGVRSGGRFLEVAGAAARQARVRGGRRSRRQDLRDRRRHDGGRVQGPVLHVLRTFSRFSAPTMCTTPPRTSGRAASRCRCRAITRSPLPSTARSTSSAAAPATASSCPPPTRMWWRSTTPSSTRGVLPKSGCRPPAAAAPAGTDGRRIYVAGGEVTTTAARRRVSSHRGVRPGDQFVDDAALHADAASRRRGRGDRQSLLPGERDDPVRRGAGVPRPEARNPHGAARHPGAAVQSDSSDSCDEERSPATRTSTACSTDGERRDDAAAPSDGRRSSTRATTSTAPKAR